MFLLYLTLLVTSVTPIFSIYNIFIPVATHTGLDSHHLASGSLHWLLSVRLSGVWSVLNSVVPSILGNTKAHSSLKLSCHSVLPEPSRGMPVLPKCLPGLPWSGPTFSAKFRVLSLTHLFHFPKLLTSCLPGEGPLILCYGNTIACPLVTESETRCCFPFWCQVT